MSQKCKKILLLAFVLSFCISTSVVSAKNDKSGNGNSSSSKSEKSSKSKVKKQDIKNYQKPASGQTNAQLHKIKIKQSANNLKEIAAEGGNVLDEESATSATDEISGEVADEIEQIAEEEEETTDETAGTIEQLESRNKFKNFLFGTDYKNLGQLRSSLVHNRNQIRKLTKVMSQVQGEEEKLMLEEQLVVLTQERERIKDVIVQNEEGFSILGWIFRLFSGYSEEPLENEEEEQLNEEVEDAITEAAPETTSETPTDTTTTAPASQ